MNQIPIEYPEYNAAAMGAGIEDMPYMSKYDACRYGWDEALDRIAENGPLFTAPISLVEINAAANALIDALDTVVMDSESQVAAARSRLIEALSKVTAS